MAAGIADTVDNISSPIAPSRSSQYSSAESQKSPRPLSSPRSPLSHRESQPIAAALPIEPAVASSSSSASSSSAGDELWQEPGPNGGSTGKRAPWSRLSNGPGPEAAGLVTGADSWPALSASSGKTSRKSSSESAKVSLDASSPVFASQGTGNASLLSSHPSLGTQLNSHVNSLSNVNNLMYTRQRSTKRNNGNTSSNGDAPRLLGSHNPSIDSQSNNSSPRDDSLRSGSVSENHGGNEHQPPQRNSFKSRSGGAYKRGDGSHSQNFGNRRYQDRNNQEWNSPRGFHHNREARMQQQQRGYPRYSRGPHPTAPVAPPAPPASGPFISSLQHRHFGGASIGYTQMPPQAYYLPVQHPMNFISPMQPQVVYLPPLDPTLHMRIINQVNYYFSDDNLAKDTYLRKNMDEHGWVPVALIAGFKKVLELTDNVQLILDVMRTSSVVEVQGDKLRPRYDWKKWIMPPAVQFRDASGAQSSSDSVAASVQTLSLDERAGNNEAGKAEADARSSSSTGTGN